MNREQSDRFYAGVPAYQKEMLLQFRERHAYREIDRDGKNWRYLASGEGDQTIVFLPGGFITADMWFYPTLKFEQAFRILTPDAFARQGVFYLEESAEVLLRMLDEEQVDKAIVIGLSAGGGVAQYFVQTYPDRVEHLVLSHCGILTQDPELAKRAGRMAQIARFLPMSIIRRILRRQTAGHIPEGSEWADFEAAFFAEIGAQVTRQMMVGFLSGGADSRANFVAQPEVVQAWSGELLVLTSQDDDLSFSSLEAFQEQYPHVQSHVFESGGHHTLFFFPDLYVEALQIFLESMKGAI